MAAFRVKVHSHEDETYNVAVSSCPDPSLTITDALDSCPESGPVYHRRSPQLSRARPFTPKPKDDSCPEPGPLARDSTHQLFRVKPLERPEAKFNSQCTRPVYLASWPWDTFYSRLDLPRLPFIT